MMDERDAPGLAAARARGNAIIALDPAETTRWKETARKVSESWVAEMKGKSIDGQALVDDARALVAKYAGAPN